MLLAHSGDSHQPKETVAPENLPKPIEEAAENTPGKDKSNSPESLTIPEIVTPTEPESITLITGLGESIFVLLIASPFLLLGLKRWLHKR